MKTDYITKLIEIQCKRSQKLYDGVSSNVIYHDDKKKLCIGTYTELSPYASQSHSSDHVSVSFMASGKRLIKFDTSTIDKREDRNSFEKYGGLIYVYEPLTQEIAKKLLKIETFNQ